MICAFFCILTTALSILQKGHIDSELLILSIQNMSDIVVFLSVGIRVYTEMEIFMTCCQRMYEYSKLEQEDELDKQIDNDLSNIDWPTKGAIQFENVVMRYREGLEPSIKGLNCQIQAGMRVGIVGRTGAGKSSILQTLFRLVEL